MRSWIRVFTIFGLMAVSTVMAQLRNTEFMASNAGTLADEDGSFEDWIEIQNNSPYTVDLFDWSLTDDAGDLTKWRFPATNLPPGQFLVVFASGKDKRVPGARLHTNFRLAVGGSYLALVEPDGNTRASEFVDYPAQVADVGEILSSVILTPKRHLKRSRNSISLLSQKSS